MGDENPIHTLGDYSKPSHEGYRNTIELPVGNNVVLLQSNTIWLVQNGCSFHRLWSEDPNKHLKDSLKLVDSLDLDSENRERTRLLLENLALYDNESWNDLRDLAKPVKATTLPQDVPSTSNRCLIELENQVQRLMEAHLAPTQPTQVNKIATSCEICSGPHDTQYCMEDPEQSFVEYASSRTDEAGEENEEEEKDNPVNIHVNPSVPPDPSISFITEKVLKLNSFFVSLVLVPQSSNTELVCTKGDDGDVMFIKIVKTNDDPHKEEPEVREQEVEYFDILPTRNESAYHKYLMCGPVLSIFLRNPIITEGYPSNLKIPCNIGHVHVEKAYIDPNSPLNIMTRMMYNWIMRRKLDLRENSDRGVSNFTGRIKGMHVFIGNFTYILDFMIVEDVSSIIDPRLSQVVLGMPFVDISNMTHDPPEGVVRNDEDRRRGVECVMSKILGFYKECLELRPEYVTGMDDEGEVTLYLTRRSLEVLRKFHWTILGGRFNQLSHVSSPLLSKPGEY
ncbi:hypothetical protein Tco_0656490 [Tanacetum coccineum]|uniref:MAK10-like protein n=1 Tax=Tanacetum coccineum TaxID=301880 RepID=A0ABQ4X8X5_9ASTR